MGTNSWCQFNEEELLRPLLPETGFFVEIGCLDDYRFSNCRHLEVKGWKGVYIDVVPRIGCYQARVTPDNVNEVLGRLGVPQEPEMMSIDIDGNDYYVFESLEFIPRVLVIEYNHRMEDGVMPRNDHYEWKGARNFGASRKSMLSLAERKAYSLAAENESNLILCRRI